MLNFAIYVLFIVMLIMGFFVVLLNYKDDNFIKNLILGISISFVIYEMSSVILFWINSYSVFSSLLFTVLSEMVILLINFFVKKDKLFMPKVRKKDVVFSLAIVIVALIMTFPLYGMFGMGQDQGVYQIKAIELIYGNTNNELTTDVYHLIGERDSLEFSTWKKLNGGFYETLSSTDEQYAGVFHGTPIWPSFLAVFGSVFGLKYMQLCQMLFLILLTLIVYFVLSELEVKTLIEIFAVAVLLLSPQLVYMVKSSLSELYFALMVAIYIMLIMGKNHNGKKYSWIPVVAIAFYHLSFFAIVPVIVVIYWGNYFLKRQKSWLWQCSACVVAYGLSFVFMFMYNSIYVLDNYIRTIGRFFEADENIIKCLVAGGCAFVLIINIALSKFDKHFDRIRKSICWGVKYGMAPIVSLALFFAIKSSISHYSYDDVTYMPSMLAMIFLTGILLVPTICVLSMRSFIFKEIEDKMWIVYVLFLYCVLLFVSVMGTPFTYMYYYARYCVPYLSIIVILGAYLLNKVIVIWTVMHLVSLLSFVRPDTYLRNTYVDTMISWEATEQIVDSIDCVNSAIILDCEANGTYNVDISFKRIYFVFDALGIDVYFCDDFNEMTDIIERIREVGYEQVYYLTPNHYELADKYTVVTSCYENFQYVHYYKMIKYDKLTKYPISALQLDRTIYLFDVTN